MMAVGVSSNVGRITDVVVKDPAVAWQTSERIDREWAALGYPARPDLALAVAQHAALVELLDASGCRVRRLPADDATGLDSVYVHDPVITGPEGVILGRMGKPARETEPLAFQRWLVREGVPVVGRIEPPGLLEGGDVVWLGPDEVVVGEGYRSNADGIEQLAHLLGAGVGVRAVALPHWTGPGDCLHLMSLLSPVADRVAVVYSRLLPATFRSSLVLEGWQLVEVPDLEYDRMACNVLPVAPFDCIMLEGCPETRGRLEAAGCTVRTYPGSDISLTGGGGPTCLTRPLRREA
jgi:N-dimethylarginine dimethylaminohydrolase